MIKRIYIGLAALLMTLGLSAQNMTSSPYSRYAYGDLNENVPTAYRAMGGVSFGLRNNRAINPAQPASYTACDTLTFMFDIAASAGWSKYQDASGHRNKPNGNLEYVTMQFPLYKRWIAMSLGLLPYSSVGYNISLDNSTAGDAYHYTTDYYGRGNISQVYGGLSFNILNWVAVGANVYYMWGDLNHMRSLTFAETGFNPTLQYEVLRVSNLRARLGAQFFHTWGDHTVNVGAIFESRMKLHSQMLILETQTADSIPIIEGAWQLPFVYGAGVSYNWQNRVTVALDFERQLMGDARYNGLPGRASGLRNKNRFALGFEYRHNPLSRKYGERMLFRVGAAMQDEYLLAIKAKHYTATAGIGFPIPMLGTVLNTTFEYHHRGQKSTLEEHSFRFILGLSIGENWFFKRKL
jgi:opacity protein-like surface antigen